MLYVVLVTTALLGIIKCLSCKQNKGEAAKQRVNKSCHIVFDFDARYRHTVVLSVETEKSTSEILCHFFVEIHACFGHVSGASQTRRNNAYFIILLQYVDVWKQNFMIRTEQHNCISLTYAN